MSVNKLGLILFSSFLIFATAPIAPAQQQTQKKTTASKQESTREKPEIVTSLEEVKDAQQALSDLGYDPGDINGMMSSDTQQAVREFQWFNDLPVTGNLDVQTMAAINTQEQGGAHSAQLSQVNPLPDQERQKPGAVAQNTTQDNSSSNYKHGGKYDKEAAERADKAARVLQDLTAASDRRIPDDILQRSEAIAVIPHMVKGAFGIGGDYGKGVVSERLENGRWSTPAFISIGGGSFGAQLGVEATDLVLVFTNRDALNLLEKGTDVKLGADASVAAGPVGRAAAAGVNTGLSGVLAYSRAKGLFAGIALDGAVLKMDDHLNSKVYGQSVDAKQILNGSVPAHRMVHPFVIELDKLAPAKRIS